MTSLGYNNWLFLVPKKTGNLRPVINLSSLNHHMIVLHLKMETQGSVRSAIRSQKWTISIDIRDAYLHVPMHQAVSRYLHVVVNQQVYQFTGLPFGLANSPQEFTKLLQPVVALLRQQGVKLHVYLRRLADQSRYTRTGQTAHPDNHQCAPVSRLDHQLREIRPRSKSGLFPSIGIQFNTRQFTVVSLPKMCRKVQSVHQHWITDLNITARDLHRLLGMLVFMASLVRRRRLCLRPVQWWAAPAWCQRTGSWSDWIQVPQWFLSEVAWWASPAVLQGLPLAVKEMEVTLFRDASSSGWGAQLGSRSTRGQWSASQRSWHINDLEMQAVINAVRDFLPHLRSQIVRLLCDNAVTVAYIKNEGNEIAPFDAADHTTAEVVQPQGDYVGSRPSARSAQHPGGFPVQSPPDTDHGVDDGHGASTTHVCQVGRAAGRPLQHSPTDDSSSSCRRIQTPVQSGQMPCPCLGTTGGTSCTCSRHSRWSLKYCRRSLNHQESGWFWSLNCNWQHCGFRNWWICPKKIRSHCTSKVKTCWLKTFGQATGWLRLLTSGRQIYTRGNSSGHPEGEEPFQGSCQHDVKVPSGIFTPSVWIPLVKIHGVL